MADITPFALRRILALRRFPSLRDAELGELVMLAENVTEVLLPAGTVVAEAGARLQAMHLVLDGEIAIARPQPRTWGPDQLFGALEVLANREASRSAVTTIATTTLQLHAADVTEILEDSFGIMLAALRGLAAARAIRGLPDDRAPIVPVRSLGLVERLILLRQQLAFSRAPLESLVALAHRAEDVVLSSGTVVTTAGTAAAASYVIIEGTSRATSKKDATRVLGPGDAIGHLEMLGGLPHEETVEVISPVRALKVEASCLLDVIEDHTDLGRAILAVLADGLLSAPALE